MRKLGLLALACSAALAGPASAQDRITRAAAQVPGFFEKQNLKFPVKPVKDVAYAADGKREKRHRLDLYLPKGVKDFPVFFFVHGGGWRSGSKDLYTRIGELFAGNGVGTVIINYRLSPRVKHPAHIRDVARALAWTYENIGKYGGRKDRIFAAGHSAGGHLVALLAADEKYLKAEKLTREVLRGVIPMSGVYITLPDIMMQSVFGVNREVRENAFPITHLVKAVAKKLPPFLVIYADKDLPLIDKMSQQFHKALQAVECDTTELEVKGRNHYTIILGAMVQRDPTTQAILRFIKKHAELPKAGE